MALIVPADDAAAWVAYPGHAWVMNKLELLRRLGVACGPVGVPPTISPVCVKPVTNTYGLGIGANVVDTLDVDAELNAGYFWMPAYEGRHFSTDCYVERRQFWWWGVVEGFDGPNFSRWESRPERNPQDDVCRIADMLPDYVGWLNVETIGGHAIEAHLRPSWDFIDLWPDGLLEDPPSADLLRRGTLYVDWADEPPGEMGANDKYRRGVRAILDD